VQSFAKVLLHYYFTLLKFQTPILLIIILKRINNIILEMGIYSNGNIFGIQMYKFNDDDFSNTLFEEKYDEVMSYIQMRETYLFYNKLNDKNKIFFKIYTECTSTLSYNRDNFMMWQPLPLDTFLEKFCV
jgi:hypothetical protein